MTDCTVNAANDNGPITVDCAIDVPDSTSPAMVDCAINAPSNTRHTTVDCAIDALSNIGPATVDHAIQCANVEGTASAKTAASSEDTSCELPATSAGSVGMPLDTMPMDEILRAATSILVELMLTTSSGSSSPIDMVQPHSNTCAHTNGIGLVIDISMTKQALVTAPSIIIQPEVLVTSAGTVALSVGDATLPAVLPIAPIVQLEEQISFAGSIGWPGDQLDNSNNEHANIPHELTLADNDGKCTIKGLAAGADMPQQVKLAINGASLQQQETQTRGHDNKFCGKEQHGDGGVQQLPLHADSGDNKLTGEEQHGNGGVQYQPPQTHSDNDVLTCGISTLQILAGQLHVFYATVNEPCIVFTEVTRGSLRLVNMSFK
ncbi:hypothetical protein GGI24_001937 [Coemansia furcata]|nr:hypothetical protein GGI24_001937 [Coemansia furcata]